MCYVQNVHTCQCLGSIEQAFTPQDVRACTCPTIVRMYGLRHKCELCRGQQKRRVNKKKRIPQPSDSSDASKQTYPTETTVATVEEAMQKGLTLTPNTLHSRWSGSGPFQHYTPDMKVGNTVGEIHESVPKKLCLKKFDIFASSSWNEKRPDVVPRMGRLILSGEADTVVTDKNEDEQIEGQAKQQMIDQLEVLLAQLTGMKVQGLVLQTLVI